MIRPQPFPSSPSYQAVVRALLRMHRFTLEGQDESEEAESLRESMNGPWEGLSTGGTRTGHWAVKRPLRN